MRRRAVIVSFLCAGALAACSADSERPDTPHRVVLGVPDSPSSLGLSESVATEVADRYVLSLSQAWLEKKDSAQVEKQNIALSERLAQVRSGAVDVVYGCTEELLSQLDEHAAGALRADYAQDSEGAQHNDQWRKTAYEALLSALPPDLVASVPGQVHLCRGEEQAPQFLVALYRKNFFNRIQRTALSDATAGFKPESSGG